MNQYIQRFKKVQKEYPLVTNHINIADRISSEMKTISFYKNLSIEQGIIIGAKTTQSLDHIEVLVGLQRNLNKILRLLSLQSIVDNGLKAKTWDFFRREILQSYGFENLLLLNNMEKVGLIKKQETKSSWSNLEKVFY